MKKAFVTLVLLLAICTSILAGTMASYTTRLDNLAHGSVVAKEFIFLESGSDTFQENVKIAPTETVTWMFAVKNFDETYVTETDLYYRITFNAVASPGKSAIDPLVISIKDEDGDLIDTINGTGSVDADGYFPISVGGQSASFIVEIYWPSNDDKDINYAGHDFGTTIAVSAVGSQFPFEGGPSKGGGSGGEEPGGEEPGEEEPGEEPPVQSDIEVLFETSSISDSDNTYEFRFTITNNTSKKINNWKLNFTINGELVPGTDLLYEVQNSNGSSPKQYCLRPVSENKEIPPGASVSFGGFATCTGDEPVISSVEVNEKDVKFTCLLGTLQ